MKNNIIKGLSIFAGVLMTAACTGNYLEINSDPYGTTDEELGRDGYIVRSALSGIINGVISPDVNTTQFTECLLGGPMAGYLADANATWEYTISNYNPTDNWTNVLLKSDKVIPVIYTNYNLLNQVTKDPIILSVGTIVKVAAMHRVTDTYGPIPYTKIGQDGKIQVEYDAQETVYATMIDELSEAIKVLTPNRTNNFSPMADILYGGVTEKWIKLANSLKLRLAMRISYANPELSKKAAEEVAQDEVGAFSSNEDNAKLTTFGVDGNPINVAVKYNMGSFKTGGDSHAAADIIAFMNGYSDPRRTVYFTESEWEGKQYVGLRHGIIIPDHVSTGHKYSGVKIATDSPIYWMNAAEVAFLKAEAVAVFGYDMGGSAKEFYERGIALSFEQYGVSGAEDYIKDNTSVAESYLDPAGTNSYSGALSQITIAWDDSATAEQKQERIITQKWIANWLLGIESWSDYRRTGYPTLIPATENGNKSNGVVDSRMGARRMPYPRGEYSSNGVNIQYAVANYLNGKDDMATRLWFDCKDLKK